MDGKPHAAPQLDPFAFPPETRGRFLMLVVAALALMGNMGLVLQWNLADSKKWNESLEWISVGKAHRLVLPLRITSYTDVSVVMQRAAIERREMVAWAQRLMPTLLSGGCLAVIAVALYLKHPERIRRRHRSQELRREEAPTVTADIETYSRRVGRSLPPSLEFTDGFAQGHAFGLRGKESLLLHGTPRTLELSWKGSGRVIALHELAHIANGDTQDRERAWAVWISLLGAYTLWGVLLFWISKWQLFGWTLLRTWTMLGMAWLIWAELIRAREFYADWRVASWGHETELFRLLSLPEASGGWWTRWAEWAWERWEDRWWWERLSGWCEGLSWMRGWRRHPSFAARRGVLRDPSSLFKVSSGLAWLTGLLLALVLISSVQLVGLAIFLAGTVVGLLRSLLLLSTIALPEGLCQEVNLLGSFFEVGILLTLILGGVLILSLFVTQTLGIQVQREVVARLAQRKEKRWATLRLLGLASLFVLGFQVGLTILPLSPLSAFAFSPVTSGNWAWSQLTLPWLLGFTVLMWLWLVYVTNLTRLHVGSYVGAKNPERRSLYVRLSSALLFAILLQPVLSSQILVNAWAESDLNPAQARAFDELVFLAFITLIWAAIAGPLWAGLSFLVAWLRAIFRTARCPFCHEEFTGVVAIGRSCRSCGQSLSRWVLVKSEESDSD